MARLCCSRCARPLKVCCCKRLEGVQAPVDLLVLQHPSEVKKAVGTARLLALGYRNCRVEVGETFVGAPWLAPLLAQYAGRCWVLFPREDAVAVASLPSLDADTDVRPLVIVLDGTWRKAQKIAHLNPWLSTLPAIALAPEAPSRYRIRKAPRGDSLSTIEATVALMRQWSGDPGEGEPLLDAFEQMVNHQIEAMGPELYAKNYLQRE